MTLTSHFAGNKVTLFDFQLAEQMNDQYQIVNHDFNMYPYITSKQWASLKIFFFGTFLTIVIAQQFIHFGDKYPSAYQRGMKP